MARVPLRGWARACAAAAVLIALTVIATPATAADGDEDGGLGISVSVISPATPPGTTVTTPGGGSTISRPTTPAPSGVATGPTDAAPDPGDIEIAGGLYLGDIGGAARPTVNPFGGTSELWITLRNRSTDTIDLTADFSLATFYGARIDGRTVSVASIKPGESRVVATTLHGSGQWPFVIGRVVVDPPDTIAGQETAPVARAGVVWVFPWMILAVLVLAGVAILLFRLSAASTGPATTAATGATA